MRVIHVTPFYEPVWEAGGTARAAAALCRALAARGHSVTVVTAGAGRGPAEEERDGVRVLRLRSAPLSDRVLMPWAPRAGRLLRKLSRDADLGHVHGHRSFLALAAARAFGSAGLPFVLEPHGTYPDHGQLAWAKRVFDTLAGGRVLRLASVLVAKSEAEARDLPRHAEVVPNGVESPAAPPKGAAGSRLLFVGNDRPQKRGLRLRRLLEALPEARLDVVGPVGSSFRAAFAGFGPRVAFRGVLAPRALAAAYAAADLLVHPAVGEAFGLVAFEAALCATAGVVSADHGCGEWYARAGGATVPADDDAALEWTVAARLRDPEARAAEARAVAAFAARELTWATAGHRVEALYTQLSAAAGRAP